MLLKMAEIKEQTKNKRKTVKKLPEMVFTVDETLDKYKGPEFESPKLKQVSEKFAKLETIQR
jgi:hypothetical protein